MVICYDVMLPESGRLCKLLVRKSANTDCRGWIYSKWSPWSAGCGSWSCEPVRASRLGEALAKTEDLSKPEWCFERCLQFGQNLEELAHGVRPGHADILVLEHEEIAVPRLRMYPPKFM